MNRRIKTFPDGSFLEYDHGLFDEHCIYLKTPTRERYAPRDEQYFQIIQDLGQKFSNRQLYDDFVRVFDKAAEKIEPETLGFIEGISLKYAEEALNVEILFTVLYATMLAEENKAFTKLGKRVKRLGIHQLLLEGFSVQEAANYSKNKKWQEISAECEKRGF